VDRVAHRDLHFLAADGVGDVRYRHDPGREVAPGGPVLDGRADAGLHVVGQRITRAQLHEEHHPRIVAELLADDHRVLHLRHRLHRRVDLRRADADAARVEGRIRPAEDDQPAGVAPDHEVVPVVPHARVGLEVGRPVAAAVVVAPEPEGHGGEGLSADQLAPLVPDAVAVQVDGVHVHAQGTALQLPRVDRQHGVADGETAVEVGPAADGGELDVGMDLPVDVVEALGAER
jgi:hypothetical protein